MSTFFAELAGYANRLSAPASLHGTFPHGASGRALEPHSYLKLRILYPCMVFLHMVLPVGGN
jgi:hypothetical protein